MTATTPGITYSIVSHAQGAIVANLLGDLRTTVAPSEVLLTLNVPEDERFLAGFADLPLQVHRNPTAKGFGANHNAAFARSGSPVFVVLNPDIRMPGFDTGPMLESLADTRTGVWGPVVRSSSGHVEDSARRFPTFMRLARRVVLRQRDPDYAPNGRPQVVDWIAGMFIATTREAFQSVRGFDERFFMYMEDADLCRRLRRRGASVIYDPRVSVVHDAQRASRKSMTHLRWHLRSALRFLTGI